MKAAPGVDEAVPGPDLFGAPIVVDPAGVKAGETLRVTGGTYQPGTTVELDAAQFNEPMLEPETSGMEPGSSQTRISDTVTVTADEKGYFDTSLVIREGTEPSEVGVVAKSSDGKNAIVPTKVN